MHCATLLWRHWRLAQPSSLKTTPIYFGNCLLSRRFLQLKYNILSHQVGLDCSSYWSIVLVFGKETNQIWNKRETERHSLKRWENPRVLDPVQSLGRLTWYWIIDEPLAGDWQRYALREEQQLKFFRRTAITWMNEWKGNATQRKGRGRRAAAACHEPWYRSRCVCLCVSLRRALKNQTTQFDIVLQQKPHKRWVGGRMTPPPPPTLRQKGISLPPCNDTYPHYTHSVCVCVSMSRGWNWNSFLNKGEKKPLKKLEIKMKMILHIEDDHPRWTLRSLEGGI